MLSLLLSLSLIVSGATGFIHGFNNEAVFMTFLLSFMFYFIYTLWMALELTLNIKKKILTSEVLTIGPLRYMGLIFLDNISFIILLPYILRPKVIKRINGYRTIDDNDYYSVISYEGSYAVKFFWKEKDRVKHLLSNNDWDAV